MTVGLDRIPRVDIATFRDAVIGAVSAGERLSALFAVPEKRLDPGAAGFRLLAVLARDADGTLSVVSATVAEAYPALTPACLQAQGFEREIHEQWGLLPEGHPWLKPLRFQARYPDAAGSSAAPTIGLTDFFRLEGDEVHEVAVGPVHAGIIEPGHFRFQCHGENVYHLEISLGYQHRGVEPALVGGPDRRTLHFVETLAGDTTLGHAFAYAQVVEGLAGAKVSARAQALRGIALELERLANHTGDLGALAGDVGYLPTAAYAGRIRGDFLNLIALLCGSRFGRGMVTPGGVGFDADFYRIRELLERLDRAEKDVMTATELLWDTASVMARFENTGIVSRELCETLGLVGPAARAGGLRRDVRCDFPSGIYRFAHIPMAVLTMGDVFARAFVRRLEIQRSIEFIRNQAGSLPEGPIGQELGPLGANRLAVSLIEGWRGEICHVTLTDAQGRFAHYKVVDPSFHNWLGLAMAMRDQPISDFPLCNKSFNLSYCGHDL
ncbi:MAG: hydrogenase [Lentisphaerae bacterium]|nr:hydrogenase [Lentisphaerota bacterium]